METRLRGLMEQTGCRSFGELYCRARGESSGVIERSIIGAITTGETSFFRDAVPFHLLRQKLLPDLVARRSREGLARIPIRIWSAACSSGQELYSIAMVVREVLGPLEKYDIRLLGTDISADAVQRAKAGIYNCVEAIRGTDEGTLSRYFQQHQEGWRVRDEIRALASFRVVNLMRDFSMLGEFDVIFCRNVAIYFSEADKTALFGRIARNLAADGSLIVGSTESLVGTCPQFASMRDCGAVYYQKAAAR
jgi:chemotaxis protein methyltransferase CheR